MNKDKTYGGFEQFTRPIERFVDKVSITRKGRIGFNKSIDAKYGLRGYSRVILYWRRAENEIGIEFLSDTVEDKTMKLLIDSRGAGVHLSALNFFKTYAIDLDAVEGRYEYRKVPVRQYGIERDSFMLIVKISK